ncbi:MAG: ATP-binding protein [Oceanospirillaceae bacterium]
MQLRSFFVAYKKQNPLAIKLLASIILCSSIVTLLATGSQLYFDYQYERKAIDEEVSQIESSSLASLENSLWEISPEQIQLQLEGMSKLRDIEFLSIDTPFKEHYSSGRLTSKSVIEKSYQLTHTQEDKNYHLGTLRIVISLENLHDRLWGKALVILLSQGIKTFLVSMFILAIFHHLVTQHLATMAKYARALHLNKLTSALALNRKVSTKPDELTNVTDSFNSMRTNMLEDLQKREQAELQLAHLNENLEQIVEQRTAQLQQANTELQTTLENLKQTQAQLIQSKKMASLGNLVAGVAHEISTPIGIGYTAASYLEQQAKKHQGELADIAIESSQMICENLERAASLVTAFKQVSVDQTHEKKRIFNFASYLQEILLSLKPKLRNSGAQVTIECPASLALNSYPGSYYQIFNNLIINSLIHAPAAPGNPVQITINVTCEDDSIVINYTDDGIGLNSEWLNNVFEPFSTSKRSIGCTGLGMHISYNIVTQLLKGTIACLASSRGAHFQIVLKQSDA